MRAPPIFPRNNFTFRSSSLSFLEKVTVSSRHGMSCLAICLPRDKSTSSTVPHHLFVITRLPRNDLVSMGKRGWLTVTRFAKKAAANEACRWLLRKTGGVHFFGTRKVKGDANPRTQRNSSNVVRAACVGMGGYLLTLATRAFASPRRSRFCEHSSV